MKTNAIIESIKSMLSQNGFKTTDGKTYQFANFDYLVSFKGSIVELSEQCGNAVVKQNFNLQSLREFKDKTLPIRIALSKDMPFFNWGF